jgi:hypothetical protein
MDAETRTPLRSGGPTWLDWFMLAFSVVIVAWLAVAH